MIENVNIDIFKEFENSKVSCALVHCCNCFHTMGAGIAKSIRDKYPQAYTSDCNTRCGDKEKLGEVSFASVENNKIIFNLYGQYRYGRDKRYTNYEAVYSGLEKIKEACEAANIEVILIPHGMGCNLAGGDWRIIETIITVIFENFQGVIKICKI